MFQHTIDRVGSIVPKEQVVSIVGRGHRKYLGEFEGNAPPGLLIEQPRDMGTAAGVFLPMAYVLSKCPDATVVLFPSDHFVLPEAHFRCEMLRAIEMAEANRDQVVLVGAIPDRAGANYDCIGPGPSLNNGYTPASYWPANTEPMGETPTFENDVELIPKDYLWNTMIVAAKAKTLWSLGREHLPAVMVYFDAFLTVLRAIHERRLDPAWESKSLDALYNNVMPADFSEDLLRHISMQSTVLRMEGVFWSEWRDPQRVLETLTKLGRRPLFESFHPDHARTPEPSTLESWWRHYQKRGLIERLYRDPNGRSEPERT